MCYNFATFVLYLDVITLIYRENRLTSSETCLSAEEKQRTRELAHKELTLFYILKDWRFRKAFMRNPKRASLDSVPKSV